MSHLLDEEDDDDLRGHRDRELTLSTGAIIAIFFGLVLICGLFFAFGYNMGSHKAVPPTSTDSSDSSPPAPSANFNTFKPAAGSPAASEASSPATSSSATVPSSSSGPAGQTPSATPSTVVRVRPSDDSETSAPVVHASAVPPLHPAVVAPPPPAVESTFMVQVAAVSHQEDADLLVNALKAKGYAVTARSNPSDQLVHIQVGPFNNRKDADSMRQRLLNDGYNAIIK